MKESFIDEIKKLIAESTKLIKWFNDKKTYIVAVATFTYAITGGISGKIGWEEAIAIALGAAGLGAAGHKVQKVLDLLRKVRKLE